MRDNYFIAGEYVRHFYSITVYEFIASALFSMVYLIDRKERIVNGLK